MYRQVPLDHSVLAYTQVDRGICLLIVKISFEKLGRYTFSNLRFVLLIRT
jgi:hypothetical protein